MSKAVTPEFLARTGTEFGEQAALFCWSALASTRALLPAMYREDGHCKLYSTFQNFTDAVKGARAKQIGIKAGVADIFLPVMRPPESYGDPHTGGLYIELKRNPLHPVNKGKKFKPSGPQTDFAIQVMRDGYGWALCYGWEAARDVIIQYLS